MDRFLIGFTDKNASIQTDLRPWLIADNAFETLENVYVFRGRIRKRFGSTLMGLGWSSSLEAPLFSRAAINLGNTNGSGNISVTVPGSQFNIGQMFSIGTEIFTVYQTGLPANMLTTGSSTVYTYNTTTGVVVINGATINTPLLFYPALPIMGITIYTSGPINDQPSYAFDTQFAYEFSGSSWQRSGSGVSPIWHGTADNFFLTCNWSGIADNNITLFVTNFNATVPVPAATDDPIWWTSDGSTWTSGTGVNAFYFNPAGGAIHTGPFVQTARIIVAFKNRLVLLNTIENNGSGTNIAYVNRCRYSHNGSPFAANAWYESNKIDTSANKADGAGFVDATTEEQIISTEFIKDRLIVFFERSTWELAYTGNQVLPFVWQKINTELGSSSQFSSVAFDREIVTVGNTGIHSCNGANVQRIDNKIPDEIFQIGNTFSSASRVAGIRDYYVEQVYWTFPSDNENINDLFPNKVLVYNYQTGAWAINDDCITCFGYYEQQVYLLWDTTLLTWEESNFTWSSGNQAPKFRQVIAGNPQGYIFIVNPDVSRNAPVLQITQMVNSAPNITLTIIDHTLDINDYILIENAQGVTSVNNNIYTILSITDADTIVVGPALFTGTYTGGGTAARVSNINILSKQYNPYIDQSQNVYISKINFGVAKTSNGEITVDYYPSSTELSMISEGTATGTIMGTSVLETSPYPSNLYPLEQIQDRLWHSIYLQTVGECIQLNMYLSPTQMTVPAIALSDFELDGFILFAQPSGRLE